MSAIDRRTGRIRRHRRVRKAVRGTASRPRLAVFRSSRNISAQVIDDHTGTTLASASSQQAGVADGSTGMAAATEVGKVVAERARTAGIEMVVFDRGGYRYHGRVAALADAARDAGLEF
ncbi:MAG TPA: 50S ribosomal protein L18 [Acidimicrobiales bacterium]|nr:50S ribosomal protein L18 [Actinomycetota bacterium]MDP6062339.1 50S ribosomal protein L18 [Acidimicrobiales bacterium]MBT3688309.1 50S ribosomal protein L18 [Actinomycetota bacterium]MBT4037207.1 50S ribosomal protein L18 [Actinomycetota bacterium]MBT4279038.1 50S ribosomal protein L18 [Actinomycetota bacterium]